MKPCWEGSTSPVPLFTSGLEKFRRLVLIRELFGTTLLATFGASLVCGMENDPGTYLEEWCSEFNWFGENYSVEKGNH